MNLQEIIEEVNKDVDDTLENADIIGWVNRCIEDITPIANVQTITTIPVVNGQLQYDLPDDWIETIQVVKDGYSLKNVAIKDMSSCGYKIFGSKLILQPTPTNDSSMDVYYKANLPYLVDMTDIPQIPTIFHDLFVLYAVSKYMYKDDEGARKSDAQADYINRKREFVRFMNRATIEPIKDVYGRWA